MTRHQRARDDQDDRADQERQDDGAQGHGELGPQRAHHAALSETGRGRVVGSIATARGHQQADLFALRRAAVHDRDQPAAVHDADAIRQLEHLIELGGNQEDGCSRVALGNGLAVDELDAANVEAARRLIEHEELQVPVEFTRDNDLLLIPAR